MQPWVYSRVLPTGPIHDILLPYVVIVAAAGDAEDVVNNPKHATVS